MPDYSEDFFANTRMSFGDHIEELRTHLWRAIIGFGIGLILSFLVGYPVLRFIVAPVENQLLKIYNKRVDEAKKKMLEEPPGTISTQMDIAIPRQQLLESLGLKDAGASDHDTIDLTIQIKPEKFVEAVVDIQKKVGRPPSLVALSATEGFMVYMKVCVYIGIVLSSPWIFYQIWSFVGRRLVPA